jgi:hypothetical protein
VWLAGFGGWEPFDEGDGEALPSSASSIERFSHIHMATDGRPGQIRSTVSRSRGGGDLVPGCSSWTTERAVVWSVVAAKLPALLSSSAEDLLQRNHPHDDACRRHNRARDSLPAIRY